MAALKILMITIHTCDVENGLEYTRIKNAHDICRMRPKHYFVFLPVHSTGVSQIEPWLFCICDAIK